MAAVLIHVKARNRLKTVRVEKLIKVYRRHTRLEKSCSTFGELPEVEDLKLVADSSNEDD